MKKTLIVVAALSAVFFASCAGAPEAAPAAPAEPPTFVFSGTELKMELEEFALTDMPVVADAKASGGKAIFMASSASMAKAKVTFPAGTYEGLVNEYAPSSDSDAFYVFIDDVAYRNFPSDPPTGDWELTTRTAMKIVFDAEKTVDITVKANSPARAGETGMKLDYIIFTKK